ncbi:PH-like super protein [Saccharomyces pastorianus]|uniref:PH-like super protein n=1 Tax=Saccharomyces pastorianus TaxID=27292 RepID=A0A6C1ED53_SACPS|nr:PH-like super protein [Saccharomyces pastorianus]
MKRIFSGTKSPKLPAPPKVYKNDDSPSAPGSPKVDQGLRNLTVSASRFFSSSSSSPGSPTLNLPQEHSINGDISPELVPIVTLLSAQAHRRYHYGILLILHDLKTDGTPATRQWEECYGVLLGTQLALWDANELSSSKTNKEDSNLKKIASRPTFINFTDASVRSLDANDDVTSTGGNKSNKSDLENVLVVSTTLKNRYFLKFRNSESFKNWNAAIRLSLFEFTALQEAYTGSFLSSRGVKLGDIKVVMADTKFTYEDWVSVRFGTGMPWKRCYAVISPQPNKKKKNLKGSICFYENDKKTKKSNAMTTVVDAKALYAVYPSSPILIDTSTIIKLEGLVSFEKHEEPQETNIFIMPEKHQGVPGYDTIIRFLIPAMNAFYLYGRPKGLIANRVDPGSLLFALPTLPHIHYLQVDDVVSFTKDKNYSHWNAVEWRSNIVQLLQKKLNKGYKGCGTKSVPTTSAMAKSPAISSVELFDGYDSLPASQLESLENPNIKTRSTLASTDDADSPNSVNSHVASAKQTLLSVPDNSSKISDSLSTQSSAITNFKDSFTTPMTSGMLNQENTNRSLTSGLKIEITDSSLKSTEEVEADSSNNFSTTPEDKHIPLANAPDLSALYDKYSTSPFGKSEANLSPKPQTLDVNDRIESECRSPYERYVGTSAESKIFEIGNVRESKSTINTCLSSPVRVEDNRYSRNEYMGSLGEFEELSRKISNMGVGNMSSEALNEKSEDNSLVTDLNLDISTDSPTTLPDDQRKLDFGEANVFDPDYMEQNQMLETESRYTTDEFDFSDNQDAGSSNYSSTQINPTETEKFTVSGRNEKIPHSSLFTNLKQLTSNGGAYQNMMNGTEYQTKQSQQLQAPHTGPQSPSYANRNLQTNASQPLASYPSGRPLVNIRTGPLTTQPMHQSGNSPINNPQFPQQRFAPSQQSQQAQLLPLRNDVYRGINNQNPLYPSQQQPQNMRYPNNKAPINSRGPAPIIQPNIQDSRSNPPIKINNHTKPRVTPGGFSQFMPPNNTSTNPYSN